MPPKPIKTFTPLTTTDQASNSGQLASASANREELLTRDEYQINIDLEREINQTYRKSIAPTDT